MRNKVIALLFLFMMSVGLSAQELGSDLLNKLIIDSTINSGYEKIMSRSIDTSRNIATAYKIDDQIVICIDVKDDPYGIDPNFKFRSSDSITNYHLINTDFRLKPYVLIKMSYDDAIYFFDSINGDSPIIDIASKIRQSKEFIGQVDEVVTALGVKKDKYILYKNVFTFTNTESTEYKNEIESILKGMRINDFEVFTYITAALDVSTSREDNLTEWIAAFEARFSALQ